MHELQHILGICPDTSTHISLVKIAMIGTDTLVYLQSILYYYVGKLNTIKKLLLP